MEAKLMSMTRVAISSSVPVLEAASSMTHCSMSFWDKTKRQIVNPG